MCGRFVASTPVDVLAREMEVVDVVLPDGPPPPRWNVAPTAPIVAVAESSAGHRRLGLLSWGLQGTLFNARAETLLDKPSFRDSYRRRRCLVPADAFYEWKDRRPVAISRADGGRLWLAGLWADGACTIVTTAANDDLADVHHRMPVVVAEADRGTWLDRATTAPDVVEPLLVGAPAGTFVVRPVRRLVNDVRRDGPELLDAPGPGEDAAQPSLLD